MKLISIYKYILLMVVLFPILGKAQHLSLEDCLVIGKENQPDFKIQLIKINQEETKKRSFASQFLPEINASLSHAYNFGSSINPNTNTREPSNIQSDNFSINAQINLFDFSKWKENKIQNLGIEIEKEEFNLIENQYDLLILEKYIAAFALQEWQKVLIDQLENSKTLLDRITKEVEEGKRAKSDWYDINVIYLEELSNCEKNKNNEILKKNELIQLLNKYDLIADKLYLSQPILIDNSINDLSIDNYPSIKKYNLIDFKLKQEYKQLLSNYLPSLFLNYSYGTFYAQKINSLTDTNFHFSNQLKDNKSQYLGLNFSIPVFSKGYNNQQRQLKKLEQNLNENLKLKEEKRLNDFIVNENKRIELLQNLEYSLKNVANASILAFETAQTKYLFDKIDASSYKSSKNQVLQANYNELNNKIDILYSQYQIQFIKNIINL